MTFRDLPLRAVFRMTDVLGYPGTSRYTKTDGLGGMDARGYRRIHPDAEVLPVELPSQATIDAAFDGAITAAPYCFAAPERDHGKDTGRTLLLHPYCYIECREYYEDAKPTTRHAAACATDGRLACDACNGDLDQRARPIPTLGEALEPADDFARPRSVA